jgi:hypothetical protein
MHRARPRAAVLGLAAMAAALVACGGGSTAHVDQQANDCTAVVQASTGIQIVDGASATASTASAARSGADALTAAAARVTTDVAGPAGQLAAAARAYAAALAAKNVEGVNVTGGLLRQRAHAVANVCKQAVLGVAPQGAESKPNS